MKFSPDPLPPRAPHAETRSTYAPLPPPAHACACTGRAPGLAPPAAPPNAEPAAAPSTEKKRSILVRSSLVR
eukprot:634254-Prymnesium_polylepis.2